MSQPISQTQNPASDKAACHGAFPSADGFPHHLVDFELWLRNLNVDLDQFGDRFSEYQDQIVSALALIDQFRDESAINFGGQESAHTPSVVPAGNTGTTTPSTGRGL